MPIKKIEFSDFPIWECQQEEPVYAFTAFKSYYLPLIRPSINKAYKRYQSCTLNNSTHKRTPTPNEWKAWREIYRWDERHKEYWLEQHRNNDAFNTRRRREVEEKMLVNIHGIMGKIQEMLSHPTRFTQVAKTDEHGRPVIYNIYPNENWKFADASKMALDCAALMNFVDGRSDIDKAIQTLTRMGLEVSDPALAEVLSSRQIEQVEPAQLPEAQILMPIENEFADD